VLLIQLAQWLCRCAKYPIQKMLYQFLEYNEEQSPAAIHNAAIITANAADSAATKACLVQHVIERL
jgi:hypothetical protein